MRGARAQLLRRGVGDGDAVHDDVALVRLEQAHGVLDQHALARARRAEQRQRLALLHDRSTPRST
jgi:hypothetical protein